MARADRGRWVVLASKEQLGLPILVDPVGAGPDSERAFQHVQLDPRPVNRHSTSVKVASTWSLLGKGHTLPTSASSDRKCSCGRPSIEAPLLAHAHDTGAVVDELPPPVFVAVIVLDGLSTIEFGFEVPWDEEHTVGVCLRDGVVVECNGSVLEP
ncbi:MAG: hypothetical protein OEW29_03605 [Acidimicrobiia bacterium]|nr:hypothetical protein [Acidimicrobiia bacterium]